MCTFTDFFKNIMVHPHGGTDHTVQYLFKFLTMTNIQANLL